MPTMNVNTLWFDENICDYIWMCVQVRRLTIFAPDMGQLQLHGPGYDNVGPDFSDPVHGANAGFLTYTIDQNYFPRYES